MGSTSLYKLTDLVLSTPFDLDTLVNLKGHLPEEENFLLKYCITYKKLIVLIDDMYAFDS